MRKMYVFISFRPHGIGRNYGNNVTSKYITKNVSNSVERGEESSANLRIENNRVSRPLFVFYISRGDALFSGT